MISRIWRYSLFLTAPLSLFIVVSFVQGWRTYSKAELATPKSQSLPFSTYLISSSKALLNSLGAKAIHGSLPSDVAMATISSLNLYVSQADINGLNQDLPRSGKSYKAAQLHINGETFNARVRYRGASPQHWRGSKKSLRIKLDKSKQYAGVRAFDLLAPSTPAIAEAYLAHKLAERLGLITAKTELVWLNINGEASGLYVLSEQVSEQTLINHKRMPGDIYAGDIAERDAFLGIENNLFKSASLWKKKAHSSDYDETQRIPLHVLIDQINQKPIDYSVVRRLVDYPSFARFHLFNRYVGSPNVDNEHNWRLYFDYSTGKFYPIVWDAEGWQSEPSATVVWHDIDNTLLSDTIFQNTLANEMQKIADRRTLEDFKAYSRRFLLELEPWVRNDPNLSINLSAFDIADFKAQSSVLLSRMQNAMESAVVNTESNNGGRLSVFSPKVEVDDKVSRIQSDAKETVFWSGEVNISGVKHIDSPLTVAAGTVITMDAGASLIFHEKVDLTGTKVKPIVIKRKDTLLPFGSIVLMGNAHGSRFEYCDISGGSSYKNALINFTAMLSLHEVKDVSINNCVLHSNADSDDMLHAVYSSVDIDNSVFHSAHGDAIDSEISSLSIRNSVFKNNNNEAVDTMLSNVLIHNSVFINNRDNAISVGQNSRLSVENSEIRAGDRALLAKDSAYLRVVNTHILNNKEAWKAVHKNNNYSDGGHIFLYDSVVENNKKFGSISKRSTLSSHSTDFSPAYKNKKKRITLVSRLSGDEDVDSSVIERFKEEKSQFSHIDTLWYRTNGEFPKIFSESTSNRKREAIRGR